MAECPFARINQLNGAIKEKIVNDLYALFEYINASNEYIKNTKKPKSDNNLIKIKKISSFEIFLKISL